MIEIRENKKLKLQNLISKELTDIEVLEFPKTLEMFRSFILARKLNPIGPIITHTKVAVENGISKRIITISTQLSKTLEDVLNYPYFFGKETIIDNCLYARFVGLENYSHLASYKLQVYAFETEKKLKGDMYTIFVGNNEEILTIDVFAPLENE